MINNRAVREVLKVFKVHLVDRIVVEVHESMVSLIAIRELLSLNGFTIKKEAKEDSETVLVFAQK